MNSDLDRRTRFVCSAQVEDISTVTMHLLQASKGENQRWNVGQAINWLGKIQRDLGELFEQLKQKEVYERGEGQEASENPSAGIPSSVHSESGQLPSNLAAKSKRKPSKRNTKQLRVRSARNKR
jgi:hypothetical protein